MGAWGTGVLDNDAALDFLGSLKARRKSDRAKVIARALEDYRAFHERLCEGKNISVTDSDDIAALTESRTSTLEWYASIGEPPPIDVLPELASEDAWAAYVKELSEPRVDDGAHEASCALAASHTVLEAIRGIGPLSHLDKPDIAALATLCVGVVPLVLENGPLRESWQPEDYREFCSVVEALSRELAAAV